MYEQVVKRGIQVYDEWYVMELATSDEDDPNDRSCHGIVAYDVQSGNVEGFKANDGVILATGGPGQAFDHTTNAVSCTGDGHAMAYRAGAPLEDMEFIQFHPTSLPSTGVLISEGVRGEGGILYNSEGERFMFEHGYANNSGELASRDVVARAELTEVNEGRGVDDEYVHLDMRHLGEERILDRLENILHLAEDFEGVDGLVEPMPVKPGQHYAMGGIEVDENGQTCVDGPLRGRRVRLRFRPRRQPTGRERPAGTDRLRQARRTPRRRRGPGRAPDSHRLRRRRRGRDRDRTARPARRGRTRDVRRRRGGRRRHN